MADRARQHAQGNCRRALPKRTGFDDFEIGRVTDGAVQMVRHRDSGRLFAMKTMSKQTMSRLSKPCWSGSSPDTFQTEASIF
jgi:hypothetical protein